MKKIKNIISIVLSVLALGFTFASCTPEVDNVAKAVRGATSVLEFAADSPQGQVITVVSDAEWHVTAPDWITVSPSTGSGTTEVTVIAADNTDSEGKLAPRKDTLIFSGNSKASQYIVIVKQEGDAYRGAPEKTVSEISSLKDDAPVIVKNATVAALTSAGFVITDGNSNVYVAVKNEDIAIGDVITINAIKGTVNKMPVINELDKLTKNSSGAMTYPEPVVLDETTIAAYSASAIDYVKAAGVVDGGTLKYEVDGKNYEIKQVDALEGMALNALDGHRVEIKGYTYGFRGEGVIAILASEIKDNGVDQIIYFSDDFEWLDKYSVAAAAGDAVGTNDPSTVAPNIFTTASLEPMVNELAARGYNFINEKDGDAAYSPISATNHKVVYLQKNYLKFGKTSYNAGIVLPALASIPSNDDICIEFDWAWQVTGGMAPDLMTLTVEASNGSFVESGSNISAELQSAQSVETPSSIAWQHVSIVLNGADASTVLTIRPTNVDTRVSNPTRKQNRWYIDNIKITPANGGGGTTPSHQTFFQDDFSWTEPIAAAVKAAGNPVGKTVEGQGADAPNIWNIAALAEAFGPVFTAKGYTDLNKDEKLVYLQDGYLKFSKTGGHNTAIQLVVSTLPDTPTDVSISFDYCMMVQGDGTIDAGPMGVLLIGDGEFENGTQLSDGLNSAQETGKYLWNKSGEIKAKGVTNKTKFVFLNERVWVDGAFKWNVSGAGRFFLDNIVIKN